MHRQFHRRSINVDSTTLMSAPSVMALREARPIDQGDGKRRVLLSSPMVMSREEKGPPFDWVKERQVLFPKMEETSPPFDWVKERRAPNFYV